MTPFCWLVRRQLDAYQDGELSSGRGAGSRLTSGGVTHAAARPRSAGSDRADPYGRRPPEAAWATFWPEVRARIAAPAPAPEPAWRRAWEGLTSRPRVALAPASR